MPSKKQSIPDAIETIDTETSDILGHCKEIKDLNDSIKDKTTDFRKQMNIKRNEEGTEAVIDFLMEIVTELTSLPIQNTAIIKSIEMSAHRIDKAKDDIESGG